MEKTTSTVFRTATPKQDASPLPTSKEEPVTVSGNDVEVPFTAFEDDQGLPFSADYYKLGSTWKAFESEIGTIENYFKARVESGDIANSGKAVDREIKAMERMNNIKDEERPVVRIGVLASYIKFLNDTKNLKRYAN